MLRELDYLKPCSRPLEARLTPLYPANLINQKLVMIATVLADGTVLIVKSIKDLITSIEEVRQGA